MNSSQKSSKAYSSREAGSKSEREKRPPSNADSDTFYEWPPRRDPELEYGKKPRNAIYSIVTALPIVMVIIALAFYYRNESAQSLGVPIRAESVTLEAIMKGLSSINGNSGQHYLWVDANGTSKGVRIHASSLEQLRVLERGEPIIVKMAPTLEGSDIYWAWYVEQAGEVFLDSESQLQ